MKSRIMVVVIVLLGVITSMASASDDVVIHKKSKTKKQGWLGVSIQDVTPRLARESNLKVKEGAYVNEVIDESPADSVGIVEGDVITEYNGKKIELAEDLTNEVRSTKPGTKVNLVVNRKGEKKTFNANIGKNKMHNPFAMSAPRHIRVPHGKNFVFHKFGGAEGMELIELNKQLGEYFEVPNRRGMLVKEIDTESNSAKAGIKAGDVITKIGDEAIRDMDDVHDALGEYDEGKKVNVELVRKGKKLTVPLEVSENEFSEDFEWNSGDVGDRFQFHMQPNLEDIHRELELNMHMLPDVKREIRKIKIIGNKSEV